MAFDLSKWPLWTASVSPFDEKGQLHVPSLKKLIATAEMAKNALLLLGSTGESLSMTRDNRMQLLVATLTRPPQVPLMVGVSGNNLNELVHWVEYLENLPVDAYLISLPPYVKPGANGQYHWFSTLMDKSSRPVMLYNIPGRVGVEISPTVLERLSSHPRCWGLKDASGSLEKFSHFKAVAPKLRLYGGDDPIFPSFAKNGAVGLVSVASNVWSMATHYFVLKSLRGTLTSAEEELWHSASNALFEGGNPVTVKHLQWKLEQISSPHCLPPPL